MVLLAFIRSSNEENKLSIIRPPNNTFTSFSKMSTYAPSRWTAGHNHHHSHDSRHRNGIMPAYYTDSGNCQASTGHYHQHRRPYENLECHLHHHHRRHSQFCSGSQPQSQPLYTIPEDRAYHHSYHSSPQYDSRPSTFHAHQQPSQQHNGHQDNRNRDADRILLCASNGGITIAPEQGGWTGPTDLNPAEAQLWLRLASEMGADIKFQPGPGEFNSAADNLRHRAAAARHEIEMREREKEAQDRRRGCCTNDGGRYSIPLPPYYGSLYR